MKIFGAERKNYLKYFNNNGGDTADKECGEWWWTVSVDCLWLVVLLLLILVFHSVTPIWSHSLLSSSVYSKVMNSKKEWEGYLEIRTVKLLTIGFLVFIILLARPGEGITECSPDDFNIFYLTGPVIMEWLFLIKVHYFKNSYSPMFYSSVVKNGYKSF